MARPCTGPDVLSDYAVTSQGFSLSLEILRGPGSPAWQAPRRSDDAEGQTHPEFG